MKYFVIKDKRMKESKKKNKSKKSIKKPNANKIESEKLKKRFYIKSELSPETLAVLSHNVANSFL